MNKKILATFLGILASFAGIVLWIILGMVGFIAGIAGAAMALLFCMVYSAINREDKSNYRYVVGAIVMVVDIILAELILQYIYVQMFGEYDTLWLIFDLVIGFLFSGISLGSHIASEKKKQQAQEYSQAMQEEFERQFDSTQPFGDFEQNTAVASTQDAPVSRAEVKTRKITVTRKKSASAAFVPIRLYFDGQHLATLENGQSFTFETTNLPHKLVVGWADAIGNAGFSNEIITDDAETDLNLQASVKMAFPYSKLVLTVL